MGTTLYLVSHEGGVDWKYLKAMNSYSGLIHIINTRNGGSVIVKQTTGPTQSTTYSGCARTLLHAIG